MDLLELFKENINDRSYHLGRMFLDGMRAKPLDGICQIDAATGEKETNSSVLNRSIGLSRCFNNFGLKPGDVMMLGGRNHLDLHIPFYAAMMSGLPVCAVDPFFKLDEIKKLFQLARPKIAFCQYESFTDYTQAAQELELDVKIVTFDNSDCTMSKFLELYGDNTPTDDFKAAEFETDKVYAWLSSTSGTSGNIKLAAIKHGILIQQIINYSAIVTDDCKSSNIAFHLSPVQWMSTYFNALSMILPNIVKLQTSRPNDVEHVIDVINEYRPYFTFVNPSLLSYILLHEKPCDFTCFDYVLIAGAKVYLNLLQKLKARLRPDALIGVGYGQTETLGSVLKPNPKGPIGCCGVPTTDTQVKLVDPDTGKEITEPYVVGEIWSKGPSFTEYYNNPEETAQAFTEDGWYRSGDLLYRDEHNNYFFADRMKRLIKYKNNHVYPPEVEELIIAHEGVKDVSVVGLPHEEDGERPLACVVRRPGYDVTAQEIKDIVARHLTETKHLHGGVVFLDELPKTSTGKVIYGKLKEIIADARKE